MLNYEVDARILAPFVPPGIELDAFQGKTLASIVAFEFADVRVLNRSVPFHRDFEEMNLRFYVRRRDRRRLAQRRRVRQGTGSTAHRRSPGPPTLRRALQGFAHGPAFPAPSHAGNHRSLFLAS